MQKWILKYILLGKDKLLSRACEWECKLTKHETGLCQDQTCICQGQINEDEDLFEDVTDENTSVEVLINMMITISFIIMNNIIYSLRCSVCNKTFLVFSP